MVLKYTIAWIPMVFIAIANGVLRQYFYEQWMKELSPHQVSSLTTPDARTIFIKPWEKNIIPEIEKAIKSIKETG